jgi:Tissue inhibitor of metalloproteinase
MKVISLFSFAIFSYLASYSCDCIPITFREEIQQSDLIVKATVISIDTIVVVDTYFVNNNSSNKRVDRTHQQLLVKIEISKIYKGTLKDNSTYLFTGIGGSDCGYPFVVNEQYLIYSRKLDHKKQERKIISNKSSSLGSTFYETSICGRTTSHIEEEQRSLEVELKLTHNKSDRKTAPNSRFATMLARRNNNEHLGSI